MLQMDSPWINRIRQIWVGISLIGGLWPLWLILIKVSHNHYEHWSRFKKVPGISILLKVFPGLDLSRNILELSNWSWLTENRWSLTSIYFRFALLNLFIVLILLFFRKRVNNLLKIAVTWVNLPNDRYVRILVAFFVVTLLVTYQLRLHLGFFHHGIYGWTYQKLKPLIVQTPPDQGIQVESTFNEIFLKAAIPAHFANLRTAGYTPATILLLHFKNGIQLPANEELSLLIFPHYVTQKSAAVHFDLLKYGYSLRRQDKGFLLPKSVSYPVHTPYMPIKYDSYPAATELIGFSSWKVWYQVSKDEPIKVVSTLKVEEYVSPL